MLWGITATIGQFQTTSIILNVLKKKFLTFILVNVTLTPKNPRGLETKHKCAIKYKFYIFFEVCIKEDNVKHKK